MTDEEQTTPEPADDQGRVSVRVNVEPVISEGLKALADDLAALASSMTAMFQTLVPAVRASLEALARFDEKHGATIKQMQEWEAMEDSEEAELVTMMRHKPSGVVVPVEEARRRVETELAARRKAAGRDHKVYETEVEPPCGREDCEGPGHPACKDECTGACTEGSSDEEESEPDCASCPDRSVFQEDGPNGTIETVTCCKAEG